jgi:hypothetical protein
MNKLELATDRRNRWKTICGLTTCVFLVGGGIAMCSLYEHGERLDALGYWILVVMLTPLLVFGVVFMLWRPPTEPDADDTEEV